MKIKALVLTVFSLIVSLAIVASVSGATYPVTAPTYIPNAVQQSATLSAPGQYVIDTNGLGTVTFEARGTCTSLAGVVQGSVDGTNYVTTNVFPITTGTITAASAVAAAGDWRVNAAGFRKMRLNVTALTASCTFSAVGSQASFIGTY